MSEQTKTIGLLLLDDHEMFREGLARTLEREADLHMVVAQCGTLKEALAVLNHSVDMVLLDVDLGNEGAWGLWRKQEKFISTPRF